jgi:hypothetical protein
MNSDFLRELGLLLFAARLKRLNDRTMNDVSKIYKEKQFAFQTHWVPIAHFLNEESFLTIISGGKGLVLLKPGSLDRTSIYVRVTDLEKEQGGVRRQ